MDLKTDIKSKTIEELELLLKEMGQPKFRAKQIFEWMHKGVRDFCQMTNLPKTLISQLNDTCDLSLVEPVRKLVSSIDGTVKYLFKLRDGKFVESVIMKYHHGYSICLSTQVGCRMGCCFCQSTKGGLERNLLAGEILDQLIYANTDLGIRISNIVLMGIGEPLDNYDNVIRFLRLVNAPEGVCIGYRHISLSTCGIVPKIYKLADEMMPITLSVSLHAPNGVLRSEMMPINKAYPLDELMRACDAYIQKTNRRISFEYTLVKGMNDSKACADQLIALLKGKLCHVNLIAVNKIDDGPYAPSEKDQVEVFKNRLINGGLNATIRRTLGSDISASCGQLRSKARQEMNV